MDKPRYPLDPPTTRQMDMLAKLFAEEITEQEFRDFLAEDMPESISKDRILEAFDALIELQANDVTFERMMAIHIAVQRLGLHDD